MFRYWGFCHSLKLCAQVSARLTASCPGMLKQPPPPTQSCKDLREDWSRDTRVNPVARNRLVSSANWPESSVWNRHPLRCEFTPDEVISSSLLLYPGPAFSSRFCVKTKDRNSWISLTVKEKTECDHGADRGSFLFILKFVFLCLWVYICFCK